MDVCVGVVVDVEGCVVRICVCRLYWMSLVRVCRLRCFIIWYLWVLVVCLEMLSVVVIFFMVRFCVIRWRILVWCGVIVGWERVLCEDECR